MQNTVGTEVISALLHKLMVSKEKLHVTYLQIQIQSP